MPELVAELIVSVDGFARGRRSPGYFGCFGPDFAGWIKTNAAIPHRMLIGRRSYELLAGLPGELRDDGMANDDVHAGRADLAHLETTDWPGLKIIRDDLVGFVRELKRDDGPESRSGGQRGWLGRPEALRDARPDARLQRHIRTTGS